MDAMTYYRRAQELASQGYSQEQIRVALRREGATDTGAGASDGSLGSVLGGIGSDLLNVIATPGRSIMTGIQGIRELASGDNVADALAKILAGVATVGATIVNPFAGMAVGGALQGAREGLGGSKASNLSEALGTELPGWANVAGDIILQPGGVGGITWLAGLGGKTLSASGRALGGVTKAARTAGKIGDVGEAVTGRFLGNQLLGLGEGISGAAGGINRRLASALSGFTSGAGKLRFGNFNPGNLVEDLPSLGDYLSKYMGVGPGTFTGLGPIASRSHLVDEELTPALARLLTRDPPEFVGASRGASPMEMKDVFGIRTFADKELMRRAGPRLERMRVDARLAERAARGRAFAEERAALEAADTPPPWWLEERAAAERATPYGVPPPADIRAPTYLDEIAGESAGRYGMIPERLPPNPTSYADDLFSSTHLPIRARGLTMPGPTTGTRLPEALMRDTAVTARKAAEQQQLEWLGAQGAHPLHPQSLEEAETALRALERRGQQTGALREDWHDVLPTLGKEARWAESVVPPSSAMPSASSEPGLRARLQAILTPPDETLRATRPPSSVEALGTLSAELRATVAAEVLKTAVPEHMSRIIESIKNSLGGSMETAGDLTTFYSRLIDLIGLENVRMNPALQRGIIGHAARAASANGLNQNDISNEVQRMMRGV